MHPVAACALRKIPVGMSATFSCILLHVRNFSRKKLPASGAYIAEYMAAFDRVESLGLKAPQRVVVSKDCVDPERTLKVVLEYYDRHTPEEFIGQTLAINADLIPLLWHKTRVPFEITIGFLDLAGKRYGECSEETIRRFMSDKLVAWQREGVPFRVWLTSPACEVIDVSFAVHPGSRTRKECARRVIYKSPRTSQGEPIYHPVIVGEDFLYQTGVLIDLPGT